MLKHLSPFPNVPAAGIFALATKELAGLGVHALHFVLGGTALTKADITNLEIKVGGRTLVDYSMSATQIDDTNTFRGAPSAVATLSVYFGNPEFLDYHDKHVTDLDLAVLRDKDGTPATLSIRGAIAGATAPTLDVYADTLAPKSAQGFQPGEHRLVKAVIPTVITPAGAVTRQSVPVGLGHAGSAVMREFWFNAHLTSVLISKNNVILLDDVPSADLADFYAEHQRTAVAGMFVWDPTVEGFAGASERTVMSDNRTPYPFDHKVTTNLADTLSVFTEIVQVFDLL